MKQFARFEDTQLSEENAKYVLLEINENADTVAKGLKALKKRIIAIDNLNANTSDEFLLRFLRGCKFNVDKAFSRFRSYYQVRRKNAHIFDLCYPSANSRAIPAKHFKALPFRAPDNSLVVIHERKNYDPQNIPFEDFFRLDVLTAEYALENPLNQMCGVTCILDYEGFTLPMFLQHTPQRMRLCTETFQNSYPMRVRGVHVVNAPRLVNLLYNIIYPFMTKKMRSRFVIHPNNDDWKSLHSFIPPEILPEQYGGQIPSTDLVDLIEKVSKKEDFFKEQLQYGFL